ncbi:unnamed protein product [Linum trigynum]|uniref:Retrotransposon Copia-like N-terminal domain-containing protein n=1 Tax=Linum trigynum TaxID=586398 RepID=A0AAV2FY18_9ROSI
MTTEDAVMTLNPATHLPLKLTSLNYTSWRSQVETLLVALHLLGFVDCTSVAPEKTVCNSRDGSGSFPTIKNREID